MASALNKQQLLCDKPVVTWASLDSYFAAKSALQVCDGLDKYGYRAAETINKITETAGDVNTLTYSKTNTPAILDVTAHFVQISPPVRIPNSYDFDWAGTSIQDITADWDSIGIGMLSDNFDGRIVTASLSPEPAMVAILGLGQLAMISRK